MKNANALHVIVQAGGRGSRLRHHTWNKPKCLVSVRNKPLIYHLFDRFPNAKFIIIGDYAVEQLEKYLQTNTPCVDYELIRANGKGTLAGISKALQKIPENCPTLIAWSDLIIRQSPNLPEVSKPVVFTTSAFTCRWTVDALGHLREAPGSSNGIPGIFYLPSKSLLPQPPENGEFVRWFSTNVNEFTTLDFSDLEEIGDFLTLEDSNEREGFTRFFNQVEITEDKVTKTAVDKAYSDLIDREIRWYSEANSLGFRRIPKIYATLPLTMERIRGVHAYQLNDLTERERRAVLADYCDSLIALHDSAKEPASNEDIQSVYIKKTLDRVKSVQSIIPGFDRESVVINGRKCRNLFAPKHFHILSELGSKLTVSDFVPIHGDPTFSNSLVDNNLRVWFIDPRGYFSKPGIMGDAWYDFAKVYYSAVGGYDGFNRRKFKLHVDDETVELLMEESSFARTANSVFKEYFGDQLGRVEILHGLIWLALSGYVKDDLDSIIGAFYYGLYWLEDAIAKA